jgi:hypothetical protein
MGQVKPDRRCPASLWRIVVLSLQDDSRGGSRQYGAVNDRILRLVAVASVALVLAGCSSPTPPPPSFTEAELEAYFDERIDNAWDNTGLDGSFERPEFASNVIQRADGRNFSRFSSCLADFGIESWGMDEQNGGPVFSDGQLDEFSPQQTWLAYWCFAEYPVSENWTTVLITADQRSYLYDYYQSWVIPCMQAQGLTLRPPPTRAEFVGSNLDWVPHDAIVVDGVQPDLEWLFEVCGDPYADLDIKRPIWF